MASPERRRLGQIGWNAVRYALGPLGGLLVPWIVIHRTSQALWGEVVTPMIVAQLAVHLCSWGNRDLLLREFNRPGVDVSAFWEANYLTRGRLLLIALPVILLILPTASAQTCLWILALFIANGTEALIVQRKRFAQATMADASGLVVQVALLLVFGRLDLESICLSFAAGQGLRAVLLVFISGADPLTAFAFTNIFHSFWRNARTHLWAGLPFLLIGLSGLLGSRMDLYTMNAITDSGTVGTYQVVAGLFVQFQALAGLIATPFTRELYRSPGGTVQRAGKRLGRLGLVLLIPFMMIAGSVFTFLFRFDLPWSVYLCGALMIWPAYAYVPRIPLLYKHGGERTMMWTNFGAAGISLLLTWSLVPRVGITGALLAAGLGQLLVMIVVLNSTRRVQVAMS